MSKKRGVFFYFSLMDKVTAPAKRITKAFNKIDGATKAVKGTTDKFERNFKRSMDDSERSTHKLTRAFRQIGNTATTHFDKAKSKADSLRRSLTQVRDSIFNLGNLAVTATVSVAVGYIYKAAGSKEQSLTALEVMLQDQNKAREMFQKSVDFANASPFRINDTMEGVTQLLAGGFKADEVFGSTNIFDGILGRAGNLASGMNKPLDQVLRAYEAVKNADFGEAFGAGMGFRSLGISKDLLQAYGLKFDAQGSYVGSVETAMTAVNKIIDDRFGNMMQRQGKTLQGLFSSFADLPTLLTMDVQTDGAKSLLNTLTQIFNPKSGGGSRLRDMINSVFAGMVDNPLGSLAEALSPEKINTTLDRLQARMGNFKSWWDTNWPTLKKQAVNFGRGFYDALVLMGRGWKIVYPYLDRFITWLEGLQNSKGAGGFPKFLGFITAMIASMAVLNTVTLGGAGAFVKWLLKISRIGKGIQWLIGQLGSLAKWLLWTKGLMRLAFIQDILTNPAGKLKTLTGYLMRFGGWLVRTGRMALLMGLNLARGFLAAIGPVGWVILAVTALVGVAIWAYNKFEWFRIAVDTAWAWTKQAAVDAFAWVKQAGVDTWTWLSALPGNVKMKLTGMWEFLKTEASAAWDWVVSSGQSALEWVQNLPQQFYDAGTNMFKSLAAGVSDSLGAVKDAVQDAGQKTIDWFREKLLIFSPSKKFRWMGKMLPGGAAQGIYDAMPQLRKAIGVMAMTAMPMMTSAQAVEPIRPSFISTSPASSTSKSIVIERGAISITIQGGEANATAQLLERRLLDAITAELELSALEAQHG